VNNHKQALLAQGRTPQLLPQLLLLVLLVLLLCCRRGGCVLHVQHPGSPHHPAAPLATPLSCETHEWAQLSEIHVADAAADHSSHTV
jgi:hypothetical protein